MAVHLEFVVNGPPISNQAAGAKGRANLTAWKANVSGEAQTEWAARPVATGNLKAVVINFYGGREPSIDLDNMSKPILDALQGIAFVDDRCVVQLELAHVELGAAFIVRGASMKLLSGFAAGSQFVYVRLEDPVAPFPLPG